MENTPELNERLRLALVSSRTAAWDWDIRSGREHRFGDLKTIFGIDAEVYDTYIDDLRSSIHPDDIDDATKVMLRARDNRELYSAEFRIVWRDGTVKWVRATGKFYYSADGEPQRMLGMATDITERKNAEDAMRESDERHRRIVETTTEGICVADSNFCITFVNQRLAQMLGYEANEMVGRNVLDFLFPEDLEHKRQIFERRRAGVREQYDDRFRHKDGSEVLVQIGTAPIFNDRGEFVGALAMVSDITERKRAEQALQQREKELREAQRVAHVGSWVWDPESDMITWSEECYRIAGRDPGLPPVTFRELRRFCTPETWERLQRAVEEALRSGTPYELDLELVRPDGTKKWLRTRGEAQPAAAARVTFLRGTIQDITDRKNAEEALRESEQSRADANRRLIAAHEEERTRIARELHDDINQRIALLAVQLDELDLIVPGSPAEAKQRIREAIQQTGELGIEVQDLSRRLHSSKLEYLGLVKAVTSFCSELSQRQGLKIEVHAENVPERLPKEISVTLFRVLQEALQNAIKHSGKRHFHVSLRAEPNELELRIHDAGVGFDPEEAMRGRGLGLISMRERLKLIGGRFLIDSNPTAGTTIHAYAPMNVTMTSAASASGI